MGLEELTPYIPIATLIIALTILIISLVIMGGIRRQARRDDSFTNAFTDLPSSLSMQIKHYNEMQEVQLKNANDNLERMRQSTENTEKYVFQSLDGIKTAIDQRLNDMRGIVDTKLQAALKDQSNDLENRFSQFDSRFASFQQLVNQSLERNTDTSTKALGEVRNTVEQQLTQMRTDNNAQLDVMRQTVDEKLQKTLDERMAHSFKQVSEQLEQVYKGLGEMQGLAQGVGDLKRVLSNVKTRGILGEIQLGAILKDILTPDQYTENVPTVPGSSERVEFAVKLPADDNSFIYLPIDSKLPGDAYAHVRDAISTGDSEAIERAWKQLENTIKSEAKDISTKYLEPPATTNFGIMFLPFEGLYAEVVNRPGLIETLQRDYRVNVAGPSTMAALLNSLQMGFQTVAIQRHADEIQKVLSAVKKEFETYQKMLVRARKQITTAGKTLDELVDRRARAMERKLRQVTELDSSENAEQILGIEPSSDLLLDSPEDDRQD